MKIKSLVISGLLAAVLAACGGGGGNNNPPAPPAPETPVVQNTCVTDIAVVQGEYTVVNNQWGRGNITDYFQCMVVTSNVGSAAVDVDFNWRWPSDQGYGIKAFPEIVYGWAPPLRQSTVATMPVAVTGVNAIKVNVDTTAAIDGTHNVAIESWLSTGPQPVYNNRADGNISHEVMIWLQHTNAEVAGTPRDTVTIDGIVFDVYVTENWQPQEGLKPWTFVVFKAKEQQTKATLTIKSYMDYLINTNVMPNTVYLNGIELGSEITNGTGTLKINDFSVTR